MPPVRRDDPYTAYNFQVILTGVSNDGKAVKGSFSEASGLEVEVPVIKYRNGSEDVDFWKWIVNALNGKVQRVSGAIVLLDENRNEVMRWKFDRAWPTKFTGPTMNAGNNEIAMETLVICTESNLIDT